MGLERDRARLRALLLERSVKRGDFTLASGQHSSYYIDCRLTTMSAEGQGLIGKLGLAAIRDRGWVPDAVGGLTMGADPVAYAIAAASFGSPPIIDAFSVRKSAKEHGTGRLIEGNFGPGIAGRGDRGRDHLGRLGAQGDRCGSGSGRGSAGAAGGGGPGGGREGEGRSGECVGRGAGDGERVGDWGLGVGGWGLGVASLRGAPIGSDEAIGSLAERVRFRTAVDTPQQRITRNTKVTKLTKARN